MIKVKLIKFRIFYEGDVRAVYKPSESVRQPSVVFLAFGNLANFVVVGDSLASHTSLSPLVLFFEESSRLVT